jgi:hypothetical protein
MEPVQEVHVIIASWLREELPTPVGMSNILNAGARLGHSTTIVFDHRCRTNRMQSFVVCASEQRCSLVVLEGVFDAKFFTYPDYSLGLLLLVLERQRSLRLAYLRDLEVVNDERHSDWQIAQIWRLRKETVGKGRERSILLDSTLSLYGHGARRRLAFDPPANNEACQVALRA